MTNAMIASEIFSQLFEDESISSEDIMNYLENNNILYGICEEAEDLPILKKSYEYKAVQMVE